MTDTNVFPLSQPGTFSDPLTEVLRDGAIRSLGHDCAVLRISSAGAHAQRCCAREIAHRTGHRTAGSVKSPAGGCNPSVGGACTVGSLSAGRQVQQLRFQREFARSQP
jgi:hypothetical protein